MRRLEHDVLLREKVTDEDGLIFFEGQVKVPQNLPVVEQRDLMSGEWFVEHEVIYSTPAASGGTWVQLVKQPMDMDKALDVLCGLAETRLIMVEQSDFLGSPSDYYTIQGEGYDDARSCFTRRFNLDTRFRIRNGLTDETIMGDAL